MESCLRHETIEDTFRSLCDTYKSLLALNRREVRTVVGLLMGHYQFNKHINLIEFTGDLECGWCFEDEESASHILSERQVVALETKVYK
ncbi:hypothetical protein JTB14_026320 [Gonioctena quinquepunctata]|nr:hypothetical protein JTB14_026320 [Gonioctena quinquepunctata]